jgi:SurA N-terminal domain/PPIC-type PPIASE domain
VTGNGRAGVRLHVALALVLAAVLAAALAACGDGGSASVVRVGQTAITKTTVDHWISAMAGERTKGDPRTQQDRTLRAQALGSLISSQWLIDEATDRGLKVSDQEIQQRFQEKKNTSYPGGETEFQEFLKATGRKASDVMFEAQAELASSKLRGLVASREPKITQAQIAKYYAQHERSFARPERRYFDIDNLKSQAEVRLVKREVKRGTSFSSMAFHESLVRGANVDNGKKAIARAIFSAKPNMLRGPVRLYGDYSLFVVRLIVPATHKSLAQARGTIEKRLATEQRQRTLAEYVRALTKQWTAKTDCHTGYVVPNCKQYKGPTIPELKI